MILDEWMHYDKKKVKVLYISTSSIMYGTNRFVTLSGHII